MSNPEKREDLAVSWLLYAGVKNDPEHGPVFANFGHMQYAKAFGHEWVVLVELEENSAGPYWGWLDNTEDAVPVMVAFREAEFRICFPYAPEEYQARGQGRVVRLSVQELTSERVLEKVMTKLDQQ